MIDTLGKAERGNRFDRAGHTYWMDGEEVPGNTHVLEDNRFIDTEFCTEDGRVRGERVHLLTAYLDEGDYDPAEAEKFGLTGYVESYRLAKARYGFTVLDVERVIFHKLFRFGTIIDRRLLWGDVETIAEIKTGPPRISHPYQTAGQELACESEFGPYARGLRRRGAFYLRADGREARWIAHTDAADRNYFLAFLTATRRRWHHGIRMDKTQLPRNEQGDTNGN